ncbi:MAG: hypothetical protein HQL50_14470 [Magnetococcales bacterium]|nr:hypothetical protein [Magnetococcales bacterium]
MKRHTTTLLVSLSATLLLSGCLEEQKGEMEKQMQSATEQAQSVGDLDTLREEAEKKLQEGRDAVNVENLRAEAEKKLEESLGGAKGQMEEAKKKAEESASWFNDMMDSVKNIFN